VGARAGRAPRGAAPPPRYCLDTWPVVEWLYNREPAASRIDLLLAQRPLMSWINVGEVAYVAERELGSAASHETVEFLRQNLTLDLPTDDRVLHAAALKAAHSISYADCFAVATAIFHGAVLLTGDPDILAGDPSWPVEPLI
jgi:predicted nucleic acid-binding protein